MEGRQVGRLFYHHDVAVLDDRLADQIEGRDATGGHQDFARAGVAPLVAHARGQGLAQHGQPLGRAVAKSRWAKLRHQAGRFRPGLLHQEGFRRGKTAGQGNHVVACREFEDLDHLGMGDSRETLGEVFAPFHVSTPPGPGQCRTARDEFPVFPARGRLGPLA